MLRLFITVLHLKPIQIYGRLLFKFRRSRLDLSSPPTLRKLVNTWFSPIGRKVCQTGMFEFQFLNVKHELTKPDDWNNASWEKLWLYNLHYFNELNAINAEQRTPWHLAYIEKWIDDNPPTIGNGWEPYTISLRVVNWIKWSLNGNALKDNYIHSLAIQVRNLQSRLEVHLLGNHLIANAKALFFAGLYFDGEEADNWFFEATKILDEQFEEQILPDGGHFERSPMYHATILEDILDIINIASAYDHTIPGHWMDKVPLMVDWLNVMSHPDGDITFFNDSAMSIAAEPKLIYQYCQRLHVLPKFSSSGNLNYMEQSGYIRITGGPAVVFLDVAPVGPDYLPAHAHADTLSFELSYQGKRLIVNSGTSLYESNAERQRQRGTSAHNTLSINGKNSSDVWGAFRVGKRAYVSDIDIINTDQIVSVSASHNGYTNVFGRRVHYRHWVIKDGEMLINDRVSGRGRHRVEINFHLHPQFDFEYLNGKILIHNDQGDLVAEVLPENSMSCKIVESTYHPEFGLSIPNKKCICESSVSLPFEAQTRFVWKQ